MSPQECGVRTTIPEVQRTSCASSRHCEGRLRSLRSNHWTRLISITNDGGKSIGYHFKATRLCWTSSWRSISFYPGKIGGCSKIAQNSKVRMSRYMDTSSTTQWPKSLESIEDPVVPLERNLYGHPLPGLSWERQFEKVLLESEWEKVPNWECLFVQRKQQLFLSENVDDIKKKAGKKQNLAPVWMKLMKNVDLHEPTSFLDHVYWRCTQRECRPNEIVIQKYKEMFESRISAGATEKLPGWVKPHAKNCSVVLRRGRTCSNMHGTASRIGEQKDRATVQSFKCLLGWSSIQERGAWISWRIIWSMLTNCLKMFVFGQK